MKPALTAVGNHYQLTIRQRTALMRSTVPTKVCSDRLRRMAKPDEIPKGTVLVDGFNLIITLETALSGSLLRPEFFLYDFMVF